MQLFNDRTIVKVQHISGLIFAVFTVLHVLTTITAAVSEQAYNNTLLTFRKYYQYNVIVELSVVIAPLVVHSICGMIVVKRRFQRKQSQPKNWMLTLFRYTGYLLGVSLPGHVFATRIHDSGGPVALSLLTFNLKVFPGPLFYAFSFVLLASALYHLIYGLLIIWKSSVLYGKWRKHVVFVPFSLLFLLAIVGVLSAGGWRYSIDEKSFPLYYEAYKHEIGIRDSFLRLFRG